MFMVKPSVISRSGVSQNVEPGSGPCFSPAVWLSSWCAVICDSFGLSPFRYRPIGALRSILPSSERVTSAAEVNILVAELILNNMSGLTGSFVSMLATPKPCWKTIRSP